MKRALGLLALFLALAAPARAWDPLGHMIVDQAAYDRLTPAAKKAVDEAVAAMNRQNGTAYTFVSAGCWMDDIRAQTKEYGPWHYIDLPYNPEGEPFPEENAVNALWAIRHATAIIKGEATDPKIDRDMALFILIHAVADIHQPLHTTSREDAGGNKVVVPNIADAFADAVPTRKNLHYFWDGAYRRVWRDGQVIEEYAEPPHLASEPVEGHNAAAALVRKKTGDYEKISDAHKFPATGNPEDWVKESHRQGYAQGYQELPGGDAANPVTLDAGYVDQARGLARQKLIQAGHRLADLLNALYPASTP